MERAAMRWRDSALVLWVIKVSTVKKVLVPLWCENTNKQTQKAPCHYSNICLLRATSSMLWALCISQATGFEIFYLLDSWVFSFSYKLTNLVPINMVKVLVSMMSRSNEFHMLFIKNKFLLLSLNLLLKLQIRLLNRCMSDLLHVTEWSSREF